MMIQKEGISAARTYERYCEGKVGLEWNVDGGVGCRRTIHGGWERLIIRENLILLFKMLHLYDTKSIGTCDRPTLMLQSVVVTESFLVDTDKENNQKPAESKRTMVSGIESSIWSYKTLSLGYLQCTSVLALMSQKAHLNTPVGYIVCTLRKKP